MTGYVGHIEKATLSNGFFRQVLFTGKYSQLVVMCLQPNEEIGTKYIQGRPVLPYRGGQCQIRLQ